LDYRVEYSRFNNAPSVSAPDNVLGVFDYEQLQRFLAGSEQL
jgi:hypothetical protein